jgi:hypothetical protein
MDIHLEKLLGLPHSIPNSQIKLLQMRQGNRYIYDYEEDDDKYNDSTLFSQCGN